MVKKPTYQELARQVEELKQGSENRFRQLIRNSFDMIVLLDSNGVQQYVSESCEKILGYQPDELVGITVIDEFIHPDDRAQVLQGFKNILENSDNGGTQYRHRHKNGTWVYLEAFGTNQIHNPDIQSVVLNVRDITERKNAVHALQQSQAHLSELNATKDRFFSIIGHDLRNPFNCIIGLSDMLLEQIQQKNYDDVEEYAQIIQKASNQAMNLLTNLLEWSRSQSGKMKFNPAPLNLSLIIHDVVELFKDSARQKSITILNLTAQDIPVLADQSMIKTVLRNLISNAIKFTNTGGEIEITVTQEANELMVSVADNGIGITEKEFQKLFRIEYNHSTLGTHNESGTGLGLLLCKEFIEMHDGRIWVDRQRTQGSRFCFSLPLAHKPGN
ncbi:PAS domain-containing sensor histidine kinase [Sunxiuqinia sp. sy24]|uniref:PAS domain-containing sensor histidine kinase n=1 Tax=Sunxiuqinia sp. sy24 TaxID=3461495 RepID=UPI0040460724